MQPSILQRTFATVVKAGSLHTAAGVCLLSGALGPCAERSLEPAPASEPALAPGATSGAPATSAAPLEPPPSAPSVAVRQQTPTARRYMLTHYADTVDMRRALVAGKLTDFRAAAAAVAGDEWTPRLRGDYRPHVEAVRGAARSAMTASSVVAAASALGKLGEACAACHVTGAGPSSPIAPEQVAEGADPGMVAHAIATDRLWAGLVLPSDSSWSSGADVLSDAPRLDSDVADVAAAARHLRDLAREGKTTDATQRGKIFASVLTTCAGCHERLGVVPQTPPAR